MIYLSKNRRKHLLGKREDFVRNAISSHSATLDRVFRSILRSLVDGRTGKDFPGELCPLLDSVRSIDSDKVRWIPYHLQYVLAELYQENGIRLLAGQLTDLLNTWKDAKEKSGEGWESLFVLFLIARCVSRLPDGTFIPNVWFEVAKETNVKVMYNEYDALRNDLRALSENKNWDELKPGIVLGRDVFVNIIYPTHNRFNVYDVFAVYGEKNKVLQVIGYQLKDSTGSGHPRPHREMKDNFYVRGEPPAGQLNQNWKVPPKEAIDHFFGESGRNWTPERWVQLKAGVGHGE